MHLKAQLGSLHLNEDFKRSCVIFSCSLENFSATAFSNFLKTATEHTHQKGHITAVQLKEALTAMNTPIPTPRDPHTSADSPTTPRLLYHLADTPSQA